MGKYPKLSYKEIRDEIIARTHQDRKVVMAVMDAHRDILREALVNGVEVGIADLCTLTFRDHPPRPAGEYWDGFTKTRHYFPNRQGYYSLDVKPSDKLKQDIKSHNLYGTEATKEEWLEYVKTYRPGQKIHDWLLSEDVRDGEQDE